MKFKQFLKPDKKKIITLIIVIILFHYLFSFTQELNRKACEPSELFPFITSVGGLCDFRLLPLLIFFNPLVSSIVYVQGLVIHQILYILLILIQLPYNYIISCFIIWIYDKLKNIKSKK
jgi:hypothetical protein